jgi:iron(III) transport system ATP-binding protein
MEAHAESGWAECALGRLRIDDGARNGPVRIMLRPEQVSLTPVPGQGNTNSDDYGGLGEILEVDFGGSECILALRLLGPGRGRDGAAEPRPPLRLRQSTFQAPSIGAVVRIDVLGSAHAFLP